MPISIGVLCSFGFLIFMLWLASFGFAVNWYGNLLDSCLKVVLCLLSLCIARQG